VSGDAAQHAWVTRVLGVQFTGAGGGAQFAKALASWQHARAQVDADLAAFRAALLADPNVKSDPRLGFVAAAATEIPNMLPAPGRQIDALLKFGGAAPSATKDVLAAIGVYRKELDAAAGLARLETFANRSLKTPLALRKTLAAAMDNMEATLRAAA
jgi:hypothetical protein